MREVCRLKFDGLPPNPNQTKGRHWGTIHKQNQEWKALSGWVAKTAYKGTPLAWTHLHYHFSVGDNRTHDMDNLIASMKAVQDGLKGIIIEDDSIDHITVSYSADRMRPRGFVITVRTAD